MTVFTLFSKVPGYTSLATDSNRNSDAHSCDVQYSDLMGEPTCEGKVSARPGTRRSFRIHMWLNLIWTITLFLITLTLFWRVCTASGPQEAGHEWHATDIAAARPFISRTQMKFTTGLYWNESNSETTFRVWNDDEPLYVGPRTPELDAAWDDITLPLDLYITAEEAAGISEIPQGMWRDPETGKGMVIVEAIHSLHCLNMLRQRIYLHEYPEMDTPRLPNHIDHCIEALRMNLMCSADMTPAPLFYSPSISKMQPNFEITHSCRDIKPLLQWARKRSVHTKYEE